MILTRRITGVLAAAVFMSLAPVAAHDSGARSAGAADVCIAVVQPLVTGVEGQADSVASGVRNLFVSFLTGPSMKALPLEARLPSQANEEARQKNCPQVLTITLQETHHGDHHKLADLTHAAGTAAGYVPYAGAAGAVTEGAAVGGTEAVSSVAYATRSKDEMTLEYTVTSTDGKTIVPHKSDSAKAKTDGEDLITPLVAKAAQVIADGVGKQ